MRYTYQKMILFRHEQSEPEMPHWCISLVPDDDVATVTFLQGRDAQNLTLAQATSKAEELNAKLDSKLVS